MGLDLLGGIRLICPRPSLPLAQRLRCSTPTWGEELGGSPVRQLRHQPPPGGPQHQCQPLEGPHRQRPDWSTNTNARASPVQRCIRGGSATATVGGKPLRLGTSCGCSTLPTPKVYFPSCESTGQQPGAVHKGCVQGAQAAPCCGAALRKTCSLQTSYPTCACGQGGTL